MRSDGPRMPPHMNPRMPPHIESDRMGSSGTIRLRRPTLVAAPMLVVALMGASMTVWLALWAADNSDSLGATFWVPLAVSAVIAVGSFVLAKGCFVEIGPEVVRDVTFWIHVTTLDRPSITTIRVRTGLWRVFEVTMADGGSRILLGASPHQFPARLLASAQAQDLADMDTILGEPAADPVVTHG